MAQDEFKLDTTFTDAPKKWVKPAGLIAGVVLVTGIILSLTTDFAERILPMDESYLTALIPRAPDNLEPLSLQTLEQEIKDNTLTVRGNVANRTDFSIAGIAVVIQPLDVYGVSLMPVEVPIDPADVPAHGSGSFQSTVTLNDRPSGYSIKFRLIEGPFVPHKDERAVPALTP